MQYAELESALPSKPCEHCGEPIQIEADGTPIHTTGKAKYSFICHLPTIITAAHTTALSLGYKVGDLFCDCWGCQFENEHPGQAYDPEKPNFGSTNLG